MRIYPKSQIVAIGTYRGHIMVPIEMVNINSVQLGKGENPFTASKKEGRDKANGLAHVPNIQCYIHLLGPNFYRTLHQGVSTPC